MARPSSVLRSHKMHSHISSSLPRFPPLLTLNSPLAFPRSPCPPLCSSDPLPFVTVDSRAVQKLSASTAAPDSRHYGNG